jgi:tetratricopeptide (TPR) repeat protein
MKHIARIVACIVAAGLALSVLSCSSAPKKTPEAFTVRNEAARLVQLGAKALQDGGSAAARDFYQEAYRMYTAVDDPEGRIRALDGLSRVSENGGELRAAAAAIAADADRRELAALASLLQAEYDIGNGTEAEVRAAAATAKAAVDALSGLASDQARALRVYGSAAKSTGDFEAALEALNRAAGIDKRSNAFIEFASDRYLAAAVHSRMGNLAAANDALAEALDYDRRAENPGGIGDDYRALALVAEKAGNPDLARLYYARARDVYAAARLSLRAQEIEDRLHAQTP